MSLSGVRAKAAEVDALVAEHNEQMRRMRTLILGLDAIWQGQAEDALVARFLAMSQQLTDFETSLKQYAEAMRDAADKTQQLDDTIAAHIRSLG